MTRKLLFSKQAEKDLAKLSRKDAQRIVKRCLSLENEEEGLDIKRLHPPLNGYRMRVGIYRILYVHETPTDIIIHAIRHRKNAYR